MTAWCVAVRHVESPLIHSNPSASTDGSCQASDDRGESGWARMPDAAEAPDVLRDGTSLAGQRVGRLRQVERHVVPIVGADFDGVDQQHAIDDAWRRRCTRRVAVIGEDDEVQARGRGGGRDGVRRSTAVRLRAVYVVRAAPQARLAGDRGEDCGPGGRATSTSAAATAATTPAIATPCVAPRGEQ